MIFSIDILAPISLMDPEIFPWELCIYWNHSNFYHLPLAPQAINNKNITLSSKQIFKKFKGVCILYSVVLQQTSTFISFSDVLTFRMLVLNLRTLLKPNRLIRIVSRLSGSCRQPISSVEKCMTYMIIKNITLFEPRIWRNNQSRTFHRQLFLVYFVQAVSKISPPEKKHTFPLLATLLNRTNTSLKTYIDAAIQEYDMQYISSPMGLKVAHIIFNIDLGRMLFYFAYFFHGFWTNICQKHQP